MTINFLAEKPSFALKGRNKIRRWVRAVVENDGKRVGEVSYFFCSDAYLLSVNQQYLQHDTYTDIVTFDYVEGDLVSGDILVSVERVRENAKTFNVPFEQELCRVVIHGILHLLGNGDKTDEEAAAMRRKEDDALAFLKTMEW